MTRQQVVAGVIGREGRILVARRRSGVHAGKWEFPGGKVEAGETPQAALIREIEEELGVRIAVGEMIASVPFTAGGTDYLLLAFSAEHLAGEYRVVDHHAISWVAAAELPSLDLAPADIPIARELRQRSIDGSMGKASTEEQAQVRR